jgi:hypothetical protein
MRLRRIATALLISGFIGYSNSCANLHYGGRYYDLAEKGEAARPAGYAGTVAREPVPDSAAPQALPDQLSM